MYELTWVIDGLLAGGPLPAEGDWPDIAKQGLQAVMSLHKPTRGAGRFTRIIVPLPNNIPPTELDRRIYRANLPKCLVWLSHRLEDKKPTLVHCEAGKDRTGLVLAYFLSRWWGREKEEILTADETIERLRERMPKALTAEGYERIARELI